MPTLPLTDADVVIAGVIALMLVLIVFKLAGLSFNGGVHMIGRTSM